MMFAVALIGSWALMETALHLHAACINRFIGYAYFVKGQCNCRSCRKSIFRGPVVR